MKQVLLNLKTGETGVADVPAPACRSNHVLIRSRTSLISAGTERMLLEFGQASLLGKARSQPERVKQVLDKIRTDGLLPTLDAVFNKLGEPLPLGYCNVGEALEIGAGVPAISPGDRVISNGPHAEFVVVPGNLCARIPDQVTDECAAFTVVASIGLQGVRLLQPTIGERFVVFGLGLIGLLAARILRNHGCEVLGADLNPTRIALGGRLGVEGFHALDPHSLLERVLTWTGGHGADGVLIAAAAKGDSVLHQSAAMCRKRGRIVLVGSVDLNLQRADFYEKELSFQVSSSYGPGRYDERYEQGGQDYPLGFVRWTEQRNFEAVLGLMARGELDCTPLITHRFPVDRASEAYSRVSGESSALGVLLTYQPSASRESRIDLPSRASRPIERPRVAVIGAGNYSKMTLLPNLVKTGAEIAAVCDLDGARAFHLAKTHGVQAAVTDYRRILDDSTIHGVFLAVGHQLHARMAIECLEAGKHVLVEKPLAIRREEVAQLCEAARRHPDQILMVGFNRRFSPHTEEMKKQLANRSGPLCMSMTVNAGAVPAGHWVHVPELGGGRIIGEGCHFVDLMAFLAGSRVVRVGSEVTSSGTQPRDDKAILSLAFADGSVGTLCYFANGAKAYPKERLEVFSDGRVLLLDNFRKLVAFGFKGFRGKRTLSQDKGHRREFASFVKAIRDGSASPIPLESSVNATFATFAAILSARDNRFVELGKEFGDPLGA